MTDTTDILRGLRELGLGPGTVVLVHSSLRSLGGLGAQELWHALREAVGDEGTVLVPTLSYERVTAANPIFDVRTTPSCVGAFPEWVRKQPGVIRSVHPTHSVAGDGYCAAELLREHVHDRTPAGPGSPFRRLRNAGGFILMLGCGLAPNTSMHGVEELTEPPYLFTHETRFTCIDAAGERFSAVYRCHGHFPQHYERVEELLTGDELRRGRVGEADAYLISAPALWKKASLALESNPYFFTEPRE